MTIPFVSKTLALSVSDALSPSAVIARISAMVLFGVSSTGTVGKVSLESGPLESGGVLEDGSGVQPAKISAKNGSKSNFLFFIIFLLLLLQYYNNTFKGACKK